ncbi:MAG: hypothetical protein EOO75_00280 [Myxococcales bacterium]|nr:MAG: hypothetical protein EOO75_00280 [Myxococcales bacterium]
MHPPLRLSLLLLLGVSLSTRTSLALITAPVGGHPGEVDANVRVTLERGKVEPNSDPSSFQKASWQLYTVGVGYTIGSFGRVQDLSLRLEATHFRAPAERNDLAFGPLTAARCRTGKLSLAGQCEFHPRDDGSFFTPQLAFNVVHQVSFSLGFFLLGSIPVGIDYKRFVVPRTDLVAGGIQTGTRLASFLTFEARLYFGSGNRLGGKQNSTVAISNLFGLQVEKWLLPWSAGVKFGTYFDGDLLDERTDPAYDQAYTVGYPEKTDRIRMMRFGTIIAPYMKVTDRVAVELSYVQKIFGYDTPATQFYSAGVRAAF